jgi:hypothetical protein
MKKPRLADVVARFSVALLVSWCAVAALLYAFPSRLALLVTLLAGCGVFVWWLRR